MAVVAGTVSSAAQQVSTMRRRPGTADRWPLDRGACRRVGWPGHARPVSPDSGGRHPPAARPDHRAPPRRATCFAPGDKRLPDRLLQRTHHCPPERRGDGPGRQRRTPTLNLGSDPACSRLSTSGSVSTPPNPRADAGPTELASLAPSASGNAGRAGAERVGTEVLRRPAWLTRSCRPARTARRDRAPSERSAPRPGPPALPATLPAPDHRQPSRPAGRRTAAAWRSSRRPYVRLDFGLSGRLLSVEGLGCQLSPRGDAKLGKKVGRVGLNVFGPLAGGRPVSVCVRPTLWTIERRGSETVGRSVRAPVSGASVTERREEPRWQESGHS